MRKIIGLFLMITVCLGLSACGAEHPEIVVSGDHASGPEGVSLEILSARKTKEQGTVLEVRWNNKSDYEVIYGEGFGIQRLEGERWMDLPMRPNTAFTAIGYGLKPHSSATKTYTLDWAYDLSQAGTYRFTADCHVYETPEGSKCELWTEFAVESNPVSLSIDARYIRTNGYWEGRNYPMAALITDREALDTYYSENRDVYNLDVSEAFSSLLQEYDAPFFKKYNLLLVLLEEGSGSITHKVSRLEYLDGLLSAWIDRIVPEAGTCDMAQWHIVIPVEKAYEITGLQVYLDGNLALENKADTPYISWSTGEYTSPPKLAVIYDGEEAGTFDGGFTWSYAVGDGTWATVCADSLHPLQLKQHVQLISCGSSQVRLEFENNPDEVTVRCWPGSAWGNTNAKSEKASMWNRVLDLNGGDWIYEVTATWNDDGGSYYGTASYVFYMAPAKAYPHGTATLYLAGESISFSGKEAAALGDILTKLSYDPDKICDCAADFRADIQFGTDYEINLTEGFVRCEKGQADLTPEQMEILKGILEWAEEETKAR